MKILLPLLFLAAAIGGCTKVKDPEFRRVDNFRIRDFNLTEGTISFRVTYFNPNNFTVAVKEAEADVYIDSVYVGKFLQDSVVQVGKNVEFSIPLSGRIPTLTALKINLKDIGSRELFLRADGDVKVGKAGVFVKKDFNYSGKHRISDLDLRGLIR